MFIDLYLKGPTLCKIFGPHVQITVHIATNHTAFSLSLIYPFHYCPMKIPLNERNWLVVWNMFYFSIYWE